MINKAGRSTIIFFMVHSPVISSPVFLCPQPSCFSCLVFFLPLSIECSAPGSCSPAAAVVLAREEHTLAHAGVSELARVGAEICSPSSAGAAVAHLLAQRWAATALLLAQRVALRSTIAGHEAWWRRSSGYPNADRHARPRRSRWDRSRMSR